MSQEQSELGVFNPFPPKDMVLQDITQQLELHPEKKAHLRTLFNTPLSQVKDKTIAVRYEDIGRTVSGILQGKFLPDENPSFRFNKLGTTDNRYYVSTLWGNPFWGQNLTDEDIPQPSGTYYDEINHRQNDFAGIAFNTAFFSHVMPVLSEDWLKTARKVLGELDENVDEKDDIVVYHNFLRGLTKDLTTVTEKGLTAQSIFNSKAAQRSYIHALLHSIPPTYDYRQIYSYLQEANRSREGVIIGYNSEVLQGNWVNHKMKQTHRDTIDLTDDNQIAIEPLKGYIDLTQNPITAIEIVGDYEEKIADQLGLL